MRNLSKRNLKKNRKTAPAPTGTAGSIQDRSEGSGQDQADSKADGRYGKGCSGRLQPHYFGKGRHGWSCQFCHEFLTRK